MSSQLKTASARNANVASQPLPLCPFISVLDYSTYIYSTAGGSTRDDLSTLGPARPLFSCGASNASSKPTTTIPGSRLCDGLSLAGLVCKQTQVRTPGRRPLPCPPPPGFATLNMQHIANAAHICRSRGPSRPCHQKDGSTQPLCTRLTTTRRVASGGQPGCLGVRIRTVRAVSMPPRAVSHGCLRIPRVHVCLYWPTVTDHHLCFCVRNAPGIGTVSTWI
jgi:hypothetical protein